MRLKGESALQSIFRLAYFQILEIIHSRIFYIIISISIVLVGASFLANAFELGHQGKVVRDLSLSIIQIFCFFITVYLCINLIPREIENKTIYLFLSRPVSRLEYITGKEIGVLTIVGISIILLYIELIVLLYFREGFLSLDILSNSATNFLECLIISNLVIMFSLISSPPLNLSLTIFIYFLGHTPSSFVYFLSNKVNKITGFLLTTVKSVGPQLEYYNLKYALLYGENPSVSFIAEITLYGILYSLILLCLSYFFFQRKDL